MIPNSVPHFTPHVSVDYISSASAVSSPKEARRVWCGWGSRAITSLSYSWGEDMAEEFHCAYTIYRTQYRPGGCGVHGMYTVGIQ